MDQNPSQKVQMLSFPRASQSDSTVPPREPRQAVFVVVPTRATRETDSAASLPAVCGMDLSGTLQGNHQSVAQMSETVAPWKKFYVHLAGNTQGAHLQFLAVVRELKQTEVFSPEDSDYAVVFCPIVSRLEVDVSEALQHIPVGKPTILVLMHQTCNPGLVVADGRQVGHPNVFLTVDCLVHEGKLLRCTRNKMAWIEVMNLIGVTHRALAKKE